MEPDLGWIAQVAGARSARRDPPLQALWSGYGEIFRVHLDGGDRPSAIVKWARPPAGAPRDASDARKRTSYQVECRWYGELASWCGEDDRVPGHLGQRATEDGWVLVLEDLDAAGFAARRRRLGARELDACLRWLAAFHARFLGVAPEGLWPIGSYWHLGTRSLELGRIDDPAVRAAAAELDRRLEAGRFRTLVHGDAKEANFCFSPRGDAVAAVDFQYVGGGCGMRDLAYLLHGRDDEPEDGIPAPHLDAYFGHLGRELGCRAGTAQLAEVEAIEREWRALFPIAKADFFRFLAGWAPDHARRDARGQAFAARVMATL